MLKTVHVLLHEIMKKSCNGYLVLNHNRNNRSGKQDWKRLSLTQLSKMTVWLSCHNSWLEQRYINSYSEWLGPNCQQHLKMIGFYQRELEIKTDHLASQRIAFEEQQLAHPGMDRSLADGESEALKEKLKFQVSFKNNY